MEVTQSSYDADNRLAKVGSAEYEYDAANNATKIAAGTYKYDDASELETGPGVGYAYDKLGERTKTIPETGPATTYGYDEAGNLVSIERTKKAKCLRSKTPTPTTAKGYALHRPSRVSRATLLYGPGGLSIEQINTSTGTIRYLHHDQAGSTRLLTGSTGTVEGTYTYTPYGGVEGHTGTATTPLGYDSQYTNTDTGLIYMRARVYDPATRSS